MDVVVIQPFVGVNGLLHDPPVSRTGNKRRFRPVLEGIFGYHRRDVRLEFNNDKDLGAWLLGLCYASPELAQAVSRIISSWVPCPSCLPDLVERAARGEVKPTPEMCGRAWNELLERWRGEEQFKASDCPTCSGTGVYDARQLWEKLRREPIPEDVAQAAGVWAFLQQRNLSNKPVSVKDLDWVTAGGFIPEVREPDVLGQFGGAFVPRPELSSRFATLSRSAPSIVTRLDAGLVTPERFASTLAAWMVMQSRSPQGKAMQGLEPVGFKPEWYGDADGKPDGHGFDNPRWTLAASIRASDTPAIVSRLDAGGVVPEVLAQWLYLQARAFGNKPINLGEVESGFKPEDLSIYNAHLSAKNARCGLSNPRDELARRVSSLAAGSLLAVDAPEGDLPLPSVLPWTGRAYRVVLYLDPPYAKTTGYGFKFDRLELKPLVKRWLGAGKAAGVPVTVGVSEACDLSEELADATGQRWWGYEIGSLVKRGSNFWSVDDDGEKKQREWLTCSSEAVRLPAQQMSIFG